MMLSFILIYLVCMHNIGIITFGLIKYHGHKYSFCTWITNGSVTCKFEVTSESHSKHVKPGLSSIAYEGHCETIFGKTSKQKSQRIITIWIWKSRFKMVIQLESWGHMKFFNLTEKDVNHTCVSFQTCLRWWNGFYCEFPI